MKKKRLRDEGKNSNLSAEEKKRAFSLSRARDKAHRYRGAFLAKEDFRYFRYEGKEKSRRGEIFSRRDKK